MSSVNFTGQLAWNRPFSGGPEPLFQSKAKCKAIDMEMIFIPTSAKETYYHKKGFAS